MPEGIVDLRDDPEGKIGGEEVAEIFAQRARAVDTWTISNHLLARNPEVRLLTRILKREDCRGGME